MIGLIAKIIILSVGAFILFAIPANIFQKADSKTSEQLCQKFNIVNAKLEGNKNDPSFKDNVRGFFAPDINACKTISVQDPLPTKEFKSSVGPPSKDAEREIRQMMSRCWWMWLEGRQKNMFDAGVFNFKNKCFVCYTFFVDKDVSVTSASLATSLGEAYDAADTSDKCAPLGGGYCRDSCGPHIENTGIKASKEDPAGRCPKVSVNGVLKSQKCCIDAETKNYCTNRGGSCLTGLSGPNQVAFTKWGCDSGTCYIDRNKLITYIDYFQGTNGANTGPGFALSNPYDLNIGTQELYAITFISPGKSISTDTVVSAYATYVSLGLTAVGTAAGIYLIVQTGGLLSPVIMPILATTTATAGTTLASAVAAGSYTALMSGTPRDYNYIMLSKYKDVESTCSTQLGAGEK